MVVLVIKTATSDFTWSAIKFAELYKKINFKVVRQRLDWEPSEAHKKVIKRHGISNKGLSLWVYQKSVLRDSEHHRIRKEEKYYHLAKFARYSSKNGCDRLATAISRFVDHCIRVWLSVCELRCEICAILFVSRGHEMWWIKFDIRYFPLTTLCYFYDEQTDVKTQRERFV